MINVLFFCFINIIHKTHPHIYESFQMSDASASTNYQNMQNQQMQIMNQMTQVINNANNSCAKGTDCYKHQQIMDAKNKYDAAVLIEQNAPEMVEVAQKDYLVATKGQSGANEDLKMRYQQNGEEEKTKMIQQFNDWYSEASATANTHKINALYIKANAATNEQREQTLAKILEDDNNATNELGLMVRKIHYTSQDVALINQVEYYVKLLYWLAFLTWGMCIVYERRFTMKTGGLFVLFTLFVLLQNRIMDIISFIIPADVLVKW